MKRCILFIPGLQDKADSPLFIAMRENLKLDESLLLSFLDAGMSRETMTIRAMRELIQEKLDRIKDEYDVIHIVGHSLAGPALLLCKLPSPAYLYLLDPSLDLLFLRDNCVVGDTITFDGKRISVQLYEEYSKYDTFRLLENRTDVIVYLAGVGPYKSHESHKVFDTVPLRMIPKADHGFKGVESLLYEQLAEDIKERERSTSRQ